jgi:hypothetical protein
MSRFVVALAIVLLWAAMMPPFFTNGACDAEFNRVSAQMMQNRPALGSPELAAAYFWRTAHLPVQVVSPEQCRLSKPSFVDQCGAGVIVYASVPVHNGVCRLYRDSAIAIHLNYDENGRLFQLQSDMKPYQSLHLPGTRIHWYWGR